MPETMPRLVINDETPLRTAELRGHEVFQTADPHGEVPDVQLATGRVNERDRLHRNASRIGIQDPSGDSVGSLNLVQGETRAWLSDVRIKDDRQGERLAVGAYLGIIAGLSEIDRTLQSDPQGLSPDSTRVWESLERRGVAERVEGVADQHGHPRFVAPPQEQ